MKTGRNIQQALFLSSLRKQMDHMSSSMRKGRLEESAQTYLNEGCSPDEAMELLTIDGYNPEMVKACLSKVASFNSGVSWNEEPEDKTPKWGFEVDDAYGRTVSNFDLDITITAGTESEALEKVAQLLGSGDDQKRDAIKVFRL
jgi:hypothetical protein